LREAGNRSHRLAHAILDRVRCGECVDDMTVRQALRVLGDL
jgi:hypothetical protein